MSNPKILEYEKQLINIGLENILYMEKKAFDKATFYRSKYSKEELRPYDEQLLEHFIDILTFSQDLDYNTDQYKLYRSMFFKCVWGWKPYNIFFDVSIIEQGYIYRGSYHILVNNNKMQWAPPQLQWYHDKYLEKSKKL